MRGFIVAAVSILAVANVAAQGVKADHYLDIPGHTYTPIPGSSFSPGPFAIGGTTNTITVRVTPRVLR
jgi:hypothetical protein